MKTTVVHGCVGIEMHGGAASALKNIRDESSDCLNPRVNLLVVDDNSINLTVACAYLKVLGASPDSIVTATNGVDAIAKCAETDFDLVLMDVQMPGIDGVQASQQIFEQFEHKPAIVAVTASVDRETESRLNQVGVDTIINKPVSTEGFRTVFSSLGLLK